MWEPCRGSFRLSFAKDIGSVATLGDHVRSSSGRPQKLVWGKCGGGVFDSLWPFVRHGSYLLYDCPVWTSPSRGRGVLQLSQLNLCKGGFSNRVCSLSLLQPPVMGVHLLCLMQTRGFNTTHPKTLLLLFWEGRAYKPTLSKWVAGAGLSQRWFSAQLVGLAFLVAAFFSPSFIYSSLDLR